MAFDKFKARKKVVQQQMADNKVFVVGVAIILLFFVFQAIVHKDEPDASELLYPEEYVQQEDGQDDTEKVATSSNFSEKAEEMQSEVPHWRFYWSDLAILGVGSAICGTMIIKERRKAREKL